MLQSLSQFQFIVSIISIIVTVIVMINTIIIIAVIIHYQYYSSSPSLSSFVCLPESILLNDLIFLMNLDLSYKIRYFAVLKAKASCL